MPRRIVVGEDLAQQLQSPFGSVELFDVNGNFLGKFLTPAMEEIERVIREELTEEQLQREIAEGGRSLPEILADLEKMR